MKAMDVVIGSSSPRSRSKSRTKSLGGGDGSVDVRPKRMKQSDKDGQKKGQKGRVKTEFVQVCIKHAIFALLSLVTTLSCVFVLAAIAFTPFVYILFAFYALFVVLLRGEYDKEFLMFCGPWVRCCYAFEEGKE